MSNTTKTIPTLNNWGDIEQRTFYKGVEVRKANKSTAVPKAGAQPMFHYVNKAGATGDWYDVKDLTVVSQEDKALVKELEQQRKELVKEFMAHNITAEQLVAREKEIDETIAKLAQ